MAEQADMSTDGVIEAFEAWAAENNVDTQLWPTTGGYLNSRTADYWMGWLAAVTSPWLRDQIDRRASQWRPIAFVPDAVARVLACAIAVHDEAFAKGKGNISNQSLADLHEAIKSLPEAPEASHHGR